MRFRQLALLGVLLLLALSSTVRTADVAGQSTPIDIARNKIAQAFLLVQQADQAGASFAAVSQLSDNLNLALSYEENATRLVSTNSTGSAIYASLSLNLSTTTSVEALSAASVARMQTLLSQIGAYSLAWASGLGSALLVLELHRFKDLVRKMKLRRIRLP